MSDEQLKAFKEAALPLMHTPDPRVQAYTAQSATGEAAGLLEQLAALSHDQWAGWIRYMFTKGRITPSGGFEIDADSYQRLNLRLAAEDDETRARALAAKDAEIRKLKADSKTEQRFTNKYIKHLHSMQAERDALRPLANIGRLAVAEYQAMRRNDAFRATAVEQASDALYDALRDHDLAANPTTATEEKER